MAKKDAWDDFDATTPVASNRIVPKHEDECFCCGHVHRNKGPNIRRCWVRIRLPGGRYRTCKCDLYRGLERRSPVQLIGPLWAYGGANPGMYGLHIWHHRSGNFTAWSLCGAEEGVERLRRHWGEGNCDRCAFCADHPSAAGAFALEPPKMKLRPPRETGSRLIEMRMRIARLYRDIREDPRNVKSRARLFHWLCVFRAEMKRVLPNINEEIERWREYADAED